MPASTTNLDAVVSEVKIELPIRLAMVETVIEMAGYGISGWAAIAEVDDEAKTYRVVPQAEFVEDYPAKTLSHEQIADALGKVSFDKGVQVAEYIRDYGRTALLEDEPGNVDAELADVVIQVAMFGEIVFG